MRADDPVVFMEHKELWQSTGEVDADAAPIEMGKVAIRHEGRDITLISWSSTANACVAAAETLATQGIAAEVIDLRILWPWDRDCVCNSIEKTGRVLVAHESTRAGGFGGELIAEIAEAFYGKLKSRPMRIGSPHVPVPYSKPLEDRYRVGALEVAAAAPKLFEKTV